MLKILVEDNGVGFDTEAMEQKLAENEGVSNIPKTVGLPYVSSRLQLWRPGAGLSLKHQETTQVEIRIPLDGNEL